MRLLLIRHPAPAVRAGICYGRLDLPVHRQADIRHLAARLGAPGFARVWTSPAQRCRVLAAAVAERCGTEATVDPRLQELDFGAWEGRPWDEIPRAGLDAWAAAPLAFAPPGGETGGALVARVRLFCADLRRGGEDGVVVTHGGPLRIMPALLRGQLPDLLAPAPPFGAMIEVEV